MSTDEKDHESTDEKDQKSDDEQQSSDTPELSDEGKEKVQRMQDAYDDERPTAVLPGTDNTITGVAVNEWLDDDGNPKFGKDEQQKGEQQDEQHEGEQHEDKQQKREQQDEQHEDKQEAAD